MNVTLTYTLTVEETNTILKGLSELPFKESSTLILKLKTEADEQLKPAEAPTDGGQHGD